jgi:Flp pilus assembly protein TadB
MMQRLEERGKKPGGVFRLLLGLRALIWLLLGVFAGAVVFVVVALAAGLMLLRLMWLGRRRSRFAASSRPLVIEGNYTVVEETDPNATELSD